MDYYKIYKKKINTPFPGQTWAGCSKLMILLVNVSLKSIVYITNTRLFWLEKCENLLHCKSFSHFLNYIFQTEKAIVFDN